MSYFLHKKCAVFGYSPFCVKRLKLLGNLLAFWRVVYFCLVLLFVKKRERSPPQVRLKFEVYLKFCKALQKKRKKDRCVDLTRPKRAKIIYKKYIRDLRKKPQVFLMKLREKKSCQTAKDAEKHRNYY